MEQLQIDPNGYIIENNKIKTAIERLKFYEPEEGYHLAFSGGKDSQCIYHLAKEAGVKFDAHYSVTTVDPPELVKFIIKNYPDVIIDKAEITMWDLIAKKGIPPTRLARYCCEHLKEHGGEGRVCVTGVRWAESNKRKNNRGIAEVLGSRKAKHIIFNDNIENRRTFENCQIKGKRVINPIVDWSTEDVWGYIKSRRLEYCKLYDEGFSRLGCIGCPVAGKSQKMELERYPSYKCFYLMAFERMLETRKHKGLETSSWQTPEDVMAWWLEEMPKKIEQLDGQMELEELWN